MIAHWLPSTRVNMCKYGLLAAIALQGPGTVYLLAVALTNLTRRSLSSWIVELVMADAQLRR